MKKNPLLHQARPPALVSCHIRGMGLVGSILGHTLQRNGIPFTWYDPDVKTPQKFVAWKASTGSCLPSGDPFDRANYDLIPETARLNDMNIEEADYCFSQLRIPYDAPDSGLHVTHTIDNLKFLNKRSYHLNVQEYVQRSRSKFMDRFIDLDDLGSDTDIYKADNDNKYGGDDEEEQRQKVLVVHAHGFHNARPTTYRWGWHCRARVNISKLQDKLWQLRKNDNNNNNNNASSLLPRLRICFNLQENRSNNTYLYPIPRSSSSDADDDGGGGDGVEEEYYLGTHFVFQRAPESLAESLPRRLEYVMQHIEKMCGDWITVDPIAGTEVEGWRPVYEDNDSFFAHDVLAIPRLREYNNNNNDNNNDGRPLLRPISGLRPVPVEMLPEELYLKPQMADGFRRHPMFMQSVLQTIQEFCSCAAAATTTPPPPPPK